MKYIFYIFNVFGFKLCWWACVLGAINNQKFLGPLLISVYLIIHIFSISKNLRKAEINLLLIAGILGTFVDSLLLNFNILSYEGMYNSINFIAPLWITGMWVGFTATLNHAFKNIMEKYFTQTVLGIVAGPIAYATGNSLGAIKFNTLYSDNFILLIIAIVWGISFPLLCLISNKIRS
tara:strand:+ start:1363 stop:1896 length:534 start_codon:yes stop_codon:yes gene_type:complete